METPTVVRAVTDTLHLLCIMVVHVTMSAVGASVGRFGDIKERRRVGTCKGRYRCPDVLAK